MPSKPVAVLKPMKIVFWWAFVALCLAGAAKWEFDMFRYQWRFIRWLFHY